MKKLLLIILLGLSFCVQAQKVSFVSEKLENHIKDLYHLQKGEDIQQIMIDTITALDISGLGLQTATDIRMFSSIKRLNVSNNKIKDINPFINLSNLEYLDLSHNEIDDISEFVMANIDKLTIDIGYNYIQNSSIVKFSPIGYITLIGEDFQIEQTNKPMVYLNYLNVYNDSIKNITVIKYEGYINNGDNANLKVIGGKGYEAIADGLTHTVELNLQDISNIEVLFWYAKDKLVFKNTKDMPKANAGENQTVKSGELVKLDGSKSSDPKGRELTFSWEAPEGIKLNNTNSVNPTFTAPKVRENTDFTFSLIVNNGRDDSHTASVVISVITVDDDNDGISNEKDDCPNTPSGETVDENGCSASQLDDDGDGVTNDKDDCPNTPSGVTVDEKGCSASQLDDDEDGVMNDKDLYPNTPEGLSVDKEGGVIFATGIFEIRAESPACPDKDEGFVYIQNTSDFGFIVKFDGKTEEIPSNGEVSFSGIESGEYPLEFVPENNLGRSITNYIVVVPEPKMFAATNQGTNAETRSVNYVLEGSKSYKLEINGHKDIVTYPDEKEHILNIPLSVGKNFIRITPENGCRGEAHEEWIILEGNIKVHPRVSNGWIYVEGLEGKEVTISLVTRKGKTVYQSLEQVVNGKCGINIAHLNDNIYFMSILSDKEDVITYIYKR